MNVPVKNGVILFLCEYGCYLRADAYLLEGYGWLFRVNNNRDYENEAGEDFKVFWVDAWFDQDRIHGTLLVRDECVFISDEFELKYLSRVEVDPPW